MARPPGAKRKPPTTSSLQGPFCQAHRTDGSGKLCKQPAGWMTSHPGQGRCKWHGGAANDAMTIHGRYANIKNRRIHEIMEELAEADQSALDLLPEANLLRALVIDYINRYDDFVDALMAWYADPETRQRPKRAMDISDCVNLVEAISRVAYRMHQIQSEGAITLDTFRRVTELMGVIVATHVKDETTLRTIERKWSELVLDARTPPPPDPTKQLPALDADYIRER